MDPFKSKSNQTSKLSTQRKTTLKWNSSGELSSVDMARILERISNPELTECDLACNVELSDDDNTK